MNNLNKYLTSDRLNISRYLGFASPVSMLGWINVLGSAAILGHSAGATEPPNIVVVLVDDLRWDELSCTGHPFARTPHIDRIACEGVRFRNVFVTTPLCSLSRASFLTGQYAQNHGIIDNNDRCAQSHRLSTFPLA